MILVGGILVGGVVGWDFVMSETGGLVCEGWEGGEPRRGFNIGCLKGGVVDGREGNL